MTAAKSEHPNWGIRHALHHQSQRSETQHRCRRRHAAPLGACAKVLRHDRGKIRLAGWRCAAPALCTSRALATRSCVTRDRQHRRTAEVTDHRGDRRLYRGGRQDPEGLARPGGSRSAATASRARSCRLRRCWRAADTRCDSDIDDAMFGQHLSLRAPIAGASARRSSKQRNRTGQ